jgi:PAS fold
MTVSGLPYPGVSPLTLPESHMRTLADAGRVANDVEIALLDPAGVIVAVNQAWVDFCLRNDGDLVACGVGASYLDACVAAGDDAGAAEAGSHVRAALAGDLPGPATLLIPCDAPGTPRWFDLLVSSLVDAKGHPIGAAVTLSRRHAGTGRPLPACGQDAPVLLTFPGRRLRAMEDALARLTVSAQDLRAALLRADRTHKEVGK